MEHPGIVPDTRLVIGGLVAAVVGAITSLSRLNHIVQLLPLALLAGLFYWLCMKTFAKTVLLLNASEAVVLNNSQIFFTSIAGVLILSERYSIEKLVGSIIVMVSVYFISAHKKLKA
jgi:drug/metabolite transporter (DMT)-like permease